jgi:hypothetical protein
MREPAHHSQFWMGAVGRLGLGTADWVRLLRQPGQVLLPELRIDPLRNHTYDRKQNDWRLR